MLSGADTKVVLISAVVLLAKPLIFLHGGVEPLFVREANQDLLQLLRPVKAVVAGGAGNGEPLRPAGVSLRDVLSVDDLDHPHHVAGRPLRVLSSLAKS